MNFGLPLFRRQRLKSLAFAILLLRTVAAQAGDGPFALSFDGVNNYVAVPHSGSFNSLLFTATAWIKTSQTAGEQGVINKYVANSFNGWQVFLFNGELRAWFFVNGSRYIWDGGRGLNGGAVADGRWHHVAFTVDTTGGRLYVDGELRAFLGWTGNPGNASTTQELRFGSYPGSGYYAGVLDEITIWSRALTPSEIQANQLHSLVAEGQSSLQAYFRVTEGTGTNIADSAITSGFSNGLLLNGPAWVPGVILQPGVLTRPAAVVTSVAGRLEGVASPGGTNTRAWFEWGATTSYGNVTPSQELGHGGNDVSFEGFLSGLKSDFPIHYRAVASNSLGLVWGGDVSFLPPTMSMTQERWGQTTTLLPNGKVLVAGGFAAAINGSGFSTNSAELFHPATGTWTPTRPMSTNRAFHTATLLQNGKVLVVDLSGAELFDPATETWRLTGQPQRTHNTHTATLLQNGRVLCAGGISNQPELYDPIAETWTPTGAMVTSRRRHTATLLQNGKVLVAGGETGAQTVLTSAELYDPTTGTWTNTGPLNVAREIHTATLLINGQVLAVGGTDGTQYLGNSERYNPVTGTWSRVGEPLVSARGYHSATLLPRGAVLVAGGYPKFPSTAEVLEPDSDVWRLAAVPLKTTRWDHTATLMPGGQVLLVGGNDAQTFSMASVEWYDPHQGDWTAAVPLANTQYGHTATLLPDGQVLLAGFGNTGIYHPAPPGSWSNAPALNTSRNTHTATLLPSGRVLVAGGHGNNLTVLSSAELFDSPSRTWIPTGPMTTNRVGHTATLLPNGRVLVAGGAPGPFVSPMAGTEIYDPSTGEWTKTGPMSVARSGHTATLLPGGKVLVAGGGPDNFTVLATAELYDLAMGSWTAVSSMTTNRSGHKATLLPNGTVLVTGGIPGAFSLAISNAEIFDPAQGTWSATDSMSVQRQNPSATLLGDGRVLVAGGFGMGYLSSAELYDPATRHWSPTAAKGSATSSHTATLLPNGKVLVTGGRTGQGGTNRTELFDAGLGFTPLWQPHITNHPPALPPGDSLVLNGFRFRGVSGASSGRDKESTTDYPVVRLRSLESERTISLASTNWSTNAYTSLPVSGLPPGWAMATLFVNGIPSTSILLEISAPMLTPPFLTDPKRLGPAGFQFKFTNSIGALFGALSTTNISLPSSSWSSLGLVPEVAPGRFEFVDPRGTNGPQRFYRVRSL